MASTVEYGKIGDATAKYAPDVIALEFMPNS